MSRKSWTPAWSLIDDVEQLLAQHDTHDEDAEPEVYPENEVADIMAVSWREKRKEISKMQR